MPSIFEVSFFARDGGLLSFGPNYPDSFRRAAAYVDRILKGEKPADLPVQVPAKYELVINIATADGVWLHCMSHHVDLGINREGRYRGVTGPTL